MSSLEVSMRSVADKLRVVHALYVERGYVVETRRGGGGILGFTGLTKNLKQAAFVWSMSLWGCY